MGQTKTCWVVSDGRTGIENQALGLAEAIGRQVPLEISVKRVSRKHWLARIFAGMFGNAFRQVATVSDEQGNVASLDDPLPDLWIACGRASLALSRAVARSGQSFVVQVQHPRIKPDEFDLVIPPYHDKLRGENVASIHGAPNRLTMTRLEADAAALAEALPGLPRPVIAAVIGGNSKSFSLDERNLDLIIKAIRRLAGDGKGILVTTSRRTGPANIARLKAALQHDNIFFWDGGPVGSLENPYFGMLGLADHILVTEESTNMITEAAFTGKPVHLLPLTGGHPKFDQFHKALAEHGAIRRLAYPLQYWDYEPLRETDRIAGIVIERWRARTGQSETLEPPAETHTYERSNAQTESRISMSDKHAKVMIIGSGAAGYTAAIYAARAMLEPVLIQGLQPGGQLTITTDVENYPGFADVIQGPWLMEQMQKQAEHVGTEMIADIITDVDFQARPFRLTGDSGKTYTADSIIIATGAQAKWLGLPSEQKFQGFGVSACATCDGFFYRGKDVAVVGGGNTAVEEALFLTNFASKVTLIHRRNSLRAERILQDRLLNHEKIDVIWDSEVEEVLGSDDPLGVTALKIRNLKSGETVDLPVHGFFVAIGHAPATELFHEKIDMKENGYIITAPDSTATNIPGVFAAGDVTDEIYRQAVTAAGMGCMAALEAEKYLAAAGMAEAAE